MHSVRIEWDGQAWPRSKRWRILCDCGLQRTAPDQLAAEEIAAVHKNKMGDVESHIALTDELVGALSMIPEVVWSLYLRPDQLDVIRAIPGLAKLRP